MSAEQAAPDAFDPLLECGARRVKPAVIGGPTHTHVCRRAVEHRDTDDVEQLWPHRCTCGHEW